MRLWIHLACAAEAFAPDGGAFNPIVIDGVLYAMGPM
jgi:hypothetical protein